MTIKALSPDDICKGVYTNTKGQRCLAGHIFSYYGPREHNDMYDELLKHANDRFPAIDGKDSCITLPNFNDSHTAEECATVWNECFAEEIQTSV